MTSCHKHSQLPALTVLTAHVAMALLCPGMLHLQATAWHVTGDDRYASKVLQIVDAHASTNKEWGLRHENGPLVRYLEA
jgi:hypothetical protein